MSSDDNQPSMPRLERSISAATASVDVHGGPPASTFRWSILACRFLVWIVWIITPLSWLYVSWWYLVRAASSSSPPRDSPPVQLYLSKALLLYAAVEVLFSLYYRYLVHVAQARTSSPPRVRAYILQTLARALEDGMKMEDPQAIQNDDAVHESGTTLATARHRRRRRAPTFSNATFSRLSFLDKDQPLAQNDPRAVDWRQAHRSWWLGARWEDLKRDNALEWLAWSSYGIHLEDAVQEWEGEGRPPIPTEAPTADAILDADPAAGPAADQHHPGKLPFLYELLYMLEARAGYQLPPGRAPGQSIRLHLDPVKSTSRPLIKYLVTNLFNYLMHQRVSRAGFQKFDDGGIEYLLRIPAGWDAQAQSGNAELPTMFIHGLGMGLAQYASMVSYFEQHPILKQRPIILLLQPHISMALFHPQHLRSPNKEGTTRGLRALVARWGFEKGITVVSHSNGTIVHGWLLKSCPDLVKRSCFVDPVTFCLWEPFIAYNFLYRKPQRGIEHLMRYFVGEELGIALMLQRHFDWSSNILWAEEIPNALDNDKTAYFLSEKDAIMNSPRTARYLRDHGVRPVEEGGNLRMLAGMAHGESLITGGAALQDLVDWLAQSPSLKQNGKDVGDEA